MGGLGEEFIDHFNLTEFIEQFVHNCKKEKKTEKRKEGARASTNDFLCRPLPVLLWFADIFIEYLMYIHVLLGHTC